MELSPRYTSFNDICDRFLQSALIVISLRRLGQRLKDLQHRVTNRTSIRPLLTLSVCRYGDNGAVQKDASG